MPDDDGGQADDGNTSPVNEFTAITTQEDLNRVIGDRVTRATAKYADYKDLQAKAAKLAEIEQANQTETEKAQARIVELETLVQASEREALRRRVAGDHGITDSDDIDLFLTGTDEDTLTRQAKRLSDRATTKLNGGNHVAREGTNTTAAPDDERAAVRSLFGGAG